MLLFNIYDFLADFAKPLLVSISVSVIQISYFLLSANLNLIIHSCRIFALLNIC